MADPDAGCCADCPRRDPGDSRVHFVACWNEFLFALILTSAHATMAPVALLSFRSSYGVEWDAISAGAFMVSLPVVLFFLHRYLVEGLTIGAVK